MGLRRGVGIRWLAFASALAAPALAEGPAAVRQAPVIWYRASQQCPSDAEFLAKLANNALPPKLAAAGDHIDFLVTLVDSGTETVGRLERQTRAGTVAIRELRDASCQRVAEGLALSLGLALEPGQAVPEVAASVAQPDIEHTEPATAAAAPPLAPLATNAPVALNNAHEVPQKRNLAIGADAGVLYGLSPRPLARGQVFVDLDPVWPTLGSRFSARAGAVGAIGSADTRIGSVRRWLLGGYVEGCPWRVGNDRFSLRPCLDFELGATGASHDGGDGLGQSTLWATPGVGLRASAALPYRLGLEAGAGAQLPLLHSEVFAAQGSLYRAEIVLFQAMLGISFGLL